MRFNTKIDLDNVEKAFAKEYHGQQDTGEPTHPFAVQQHNPEAVNILIKAGINLDIKAINIGLTALQMAAMIGNLSAIKSLISAGADLNIGDKNNCTAAHYAAMADYSEIIRLLILGSADVNIKNNDGQTALHYAADKGYSGTVNVLIKAGADVNIQDNGGKTALHYAANKGYSGTVNVLIKE
nr:ankyrin repeat domain-containing protein [Candidatus Orientia mediorientalis]